MRVSKLRLAALALTSGIVLSGCAYGMYGDPYGYGYGPHSGVSVGVGYGGGYGGYGYGGYGYGYPYAYGYGYGYGDPFGWYGDYYYPGTGIYVYDHNHNRHQWSDQQRHYWEQRRSQWQSHHGSAGATTTENGTAGIARTGVTAIPTRTRPGLRLSSPRTAVRTTGTAATGRHAHR